MTVPTVVIMRKERKKNAARATQRNASVGTVQRDLADAKAANESPLRKRKQRTASKARILSLYGTRSKKWNRSRNLLRYLGLRSPTNDELRHIMKLAKVDGALDGAINGIILGAHLVDASFRTRSIPKTKEALNKVANQANRFAELLRTLDIGRGSIGSLEYAGELIEVELQQAKAPRILLPKHIDLLEGLSSAARRAAQKPMHLPKGAGGNPAFDFFIEELLKAAHARGGSWTNYRLRDGRWKGTLLEALAILKKYLPQQFFPPGELGGSVQYIKRKLWARIK